MGHVLGLDIGTNSVGWALLDQSSEGDPCGIVACGSRIFESCVDAKTGVPLNQARRGKRLLRRQIARRAQRRDLVRGILRGLGWLPAEAEADPDGRAGVWNRIGDPWHLRAEGLDRKLEPVEFARVLLALAKRRGFQSNRKGDAPKDDEDKTETDQGIAKLRDTISASGARTLGEWVWRHGERRGNDLLVRNRRGDRRVWSERAMLRQEFEALWATQAPHHAQACTDALKIRLYRALFFQRPLKAPPRSDDGCTYEPARVVQGKPNAAGEGKELTVRLPCGALAWPEMQRLRYWQRINDLTWTDPQTLEERPLTAAQRATLASALDRAGSITWGAIRKLLKLHKGCAINLEKSTDDKGLKGNTTAARLRELLETDWDELDQWIGHHGSARVQAQLVRAQAEAATFAARHGLPIPDALALAQDLLVTDLLTIDDHPTDGPEPLHKRLQEDWGFARKEAEGLAKQELERRPGRCSRKAAKRLLPHLMAGKNLHDAAQVVGYERVDQEQHAAEPRLGEPPRLRNPVVSRALTEVRRVVNAVIAKHGTPERIRVELAREATMSADHKYESEKARKANERLNAEADEWWQAMCPGRNSRHDDRILYRLWKRQGERCLYSDRAISGSQLVDGSVQVDHILPYSRSLDDGLGNKALVFADQNQAKGNRTPREWLTEPQIAELARRVRGMRGVSQGTIRRLLATTDELEDEAKGFKARALTDTQWITRAVLAYLRQLWPSHSASGTMLVPVEAPRGHTTAALRHHWGLAGFLGGPQAKNRADHRHHALDAVVIACTSRRLYQRAADAFSHRHRTLDVGEAPWDSFRHDLRTALDGITVSHAVDRRITGAFHDDSGFGQITAPDGSPQFVIRRRIETLTPAQVPRIIDAVVRQRVQEAIALHGTAKAAAEPPGITHIDGMTPIFRVRVDAGLKRGSLFSVRRSGLPYRFHELASNHRLEVLRRADGNLHLRLVRMLDHARAIRIWERARREGCDPLAALPDDLKPLRDGTAGALVLALHKGDAVRVDGEVIGRVDKLTISGKSPDVFVRIHTDAAPAAEAERIRITNTTDLTARIHPIAVSVLGEVQDDHPHRGSGHPSSPVPG